MIGPEGDALQARLYDTVYGGPSRSKFTVRVWPLETANGPLLSRMSVAALSGTDWVGFAALSVTVSNALAGFPCDAVPKETLKIQFPCAARALRLSDRWWLRRMQKLPGSSQ